MKIKELYRRFRAWQINPFKYQDHSDHTERCANCGTEFQSNFCPVCGQKAGVGKIGWKSVRQGLMVVWGMDSRSLGFSLIQLILRPGYLISDYISGKRLVSFPPVKMLLLVAVGMMMDDAIFGDKPVEEEAIESSFDMFTYWADSNYGWAMMAISSLFLFPTWLLFRCTPKHRKHTLPEGFFIQVFLSTLLALIGMVAMFTDTLWFMWIWFFYYLITYRQLFGYSWWGTFWRFCICCLLAMVILFNLQELGNYLLHLKMHPIMSIIAVDVSIVFVVAIALLIEYHIIQRAYRRFVNKYMKKICDFIARWMGAMVLIVAAVALMVPESFSWIDTSAINPMLGVIMFGMGLTLSPADFKIVLSRPKDILIGCLTQFTVMPLLALALTWAFALPNELAIGVILVGCCPGGTASNVITYLAKGDLALSVGMTAASTLLAPLLTPLLVLALAGTMVDVDAVGMLMSIVYVVIAPIVCGLLCQRFLPKMTRSVTPYLPAFSSVVIALVVGIIVGHNADRLLTAGLLVVAVVMIHNLMGLAIGFTVGRLLRLQKPKCTALSIEVGMQNSGLASSLAVLHFAAYPLATIPGAVFSVWHNISGAMVAKLYSIKNSIEQ